MESRPWHAHYDDGVPASLEYEDLCLHDMLFRTAERYGDRPALHFLNATLTYRELGEQVRRLATALARLGVGVDSRVAIHLPNLPQTVIAFHATLACGAQAVMTNPLYVPREIEHQWKDSGCEVAITTDFLYARHLAGLREQLPVRHYVLASIPEYLRFPLSLLAPFKLRRQDPPLLADVPAADGVHRFRELIRATEPDPPRPSLSPDHTAVLQYTGGTTGVSKGAMLSHRNLFRNVQQCRAWMVSLREGEEVFLAALPYFHIFGLTISMNLPIHLAAGIVILPNPRDTAQMVRSIERHRVTLFPGVPAMFNAINHWPGTARRDLTSIKGVFSGSAPLPLDVLRNFEGRTGAVIFEGFGLTETSPATHVNPMHGTRKAGTVGLPVPDTDARIVDKEDGKTELPTGEAGELVIRGPQVMQGYWKRPGETAQMIHDGWLHTGDLASVDEDGYFRIVGRVKDMILASGYNIYPDEIDRVLTDHAAVVEACTIGVPCETRGETVKSFVQLEAGVDCTEEDLIEFCREHLAPYKVPRAIEFRDALPKSSMMKLLRRELREQELAKV